MRAKKSYPAGRYLLGGDSVFWHGVIYGRRVRYNRPVFSGDLVMLGNDTHPDMLGRVLIHAYGRTYLVPVKLLIPDIALPKR